jgi:hypothetical protein
MVFVIERRVVVVVSLSGRWVQIMKESIQATSDTNKQAMKSFRSPLLGLDKLVGKSN